jgi:hypothetical protein
MPETTANGSQQSFIFEISSKWALNATPSLSLRWATTTSCDPHRILFLDLLSFAVMSHSSSSCLSARSVMS